MPSEPAAGRVAAERLHPVSLLFSLGGAARRLLVPGLIVLYASRGGNTEFWLMVFFFPAALAAVARYWSYRYRLGEDEMIVREGIVTRNERHIPYARIQNIDLVRNPLHRMLGVAEVHLQTASGDKPEAVLRVLSLEAIETLRGHVFRERAPRAAADTEDAGPGSATLFHLPPREIVLAGLISGRGMAIVAAALGLLWQLDLWDVEEWAESVPAEAERVAGNFAIPGVVTVTFLVIGFMLAALIGLRLLSVVWAMLRYYNFTLTRTGDDLRTEYGLFTRITATIPLRRIQLLSVGSGPLHRWFGRATIQVETAGGTGRSDEGRSVANRLWLAPLIRQEAIAPLLQQVLPETRDENLDWHAFPPRAARRVFVRGIVLSLIVTGGSVAAFGIEGLVVLAAGLALAAIHARMYLKHTSWSVGDKVIAYRSGWWRRNFSLVRFNKIQSVSIVESPFDRRHGMATLAVDTAGAGRAGHRIDIRYLAVSAAREMLERLSLEAGRTAFRW